jgi:putative transposase
MPRRPRLILPDVPVHVIQRGNNRQACFYAEEDYLFYLEHLEKQADKARLRYSCLLFDDQSRSFKANTPAG